MTEIVSNLVKRTRAERKAARRAEWAKTEAQREQFKREHPVLSGAVKVVDYVEPRAVYLRGGAV